MSGERVISSVLSHCSKNLKQQTNQCYSSVLQLSFIWQAKKNTSSRHEGGQTEISKMKRSPSSIFAPLFICFFVPSLILPYVSWASHQGCLFSLRSSLHSSDLPLFYFHGLSPFSSFSHHHFGLLFPILST